MIPYGIMDLGQHWWHQAITWTQGIFSIRLASYQRIFRWDAQNNNYRLYSEILFSKCQWLFPGATMKFPWCFPSAWDPIVPLGAPHNKATPVLGSGSLKPCGWILNFVKYLLHPLNHIHIWQVSLQLSCSDTCQIWMWYWIGKQYLIILKNWEIVLVTPTVPPLALSQAGTHLGC